LSNSLRNAYPTNETGLVFHAFHPLFIESAMTTKLHQPPLVKNWAKYFLYPSTEQYVASALKVKN
jgi:hypothetical protein